MQRHASSFKMIRFRNRQPYYLILMVILYVLIATGVIVTISPLARLYILVYSGNSDAMYRLALEYDSDQSKVVFRSNGYLGTYWIRKAANKGNIHAIRYIEVAWGRTAPSEVVFWLKKGIEFKHPWCAEQLAIGYKFGLYGLPIDMEKAAHYREIGSQLRYDGNNTTDE